MKEPRKPHPKPFVELIDFVCASCNKVYKAFPRKRLPDCIPCRQKSWNTKIHEKEKEKRLKERQALSQ